MVIRDARGARRGLRVGRRVCVQVGARRQRLGLSVALQTVKSGRREIFEAIRCVLTPLRLRQEGMRLVQSRQAGVHLHGNGQLHAGNTAAEGACRRCRAAPAGGAVEHRRLGRRCAPGRQHKVGADRQEVVNREPAALSVRTQRTQTISVLARTRFRFLCGRGSVGDIVARHGHQPAPVLLLRFSPPPRAVPPPRAAPPPAPASWWSWSRTLDLLPASPSPGSGLAAAEGGLADDRLSICSWGPTG